VSIAVADQDVSGPGNRGKIVLGSTVKGVATIESFQFDGVDSFRKMTGSELRPFGDRVFKGVRVATGDVNGDGVQDLIAGQGPGGKSAIRIFDGALNGVPLSDEFLAYVDTQGRNTLFLGSYDYDGDGRAEAITAFGSLVGATDSVQRFSPTGQPLGSIVANVGDFPDLGGKWLVGDKSARIMQQGRTLVITNEQGIVSEGLIAGTKIVAATDEHELGIVEQGTIRWTSGSIWQKQDLTGTYVVGGRLARIQQQGDELRIWNADGNLSAGNFTSSQAIVAKNFGGLTAQLEAGQIVWSNGDVWTKLDLSPDYTNAAGARVRVLNDGAGNLVLVNRAGEGAFGRWVSPTQIVVSDWGNVSATVRDGQILWSNGTIWSKNLKTGGTTAAGGRIGIQVRPNEILLTNRAGGTSRARLLDQTSVYAIDWKVAGKLVNGRILWDNGTVWNGFSLNEFHAAFSDLTSLPFPDFVLKGDNARGSAIAIEVRQNLFAKNRQGDRSRLQITSPTTVVALDWNSTGTIKDGRIYWNNGTIWQGFDRNLFDFALKT